MSHIWSDPQRHWEQGIDVLRDDPMSMTDPVLYQIYIGALAKLTFGNGHLAAFYTFLLSISMPWLWYRFFRELQPSKDIALLGWAIVSWVPSWLGIYAYFMQETLMMPLLGAALWATWRCHRKQSLNAFLLMVFIWVLAGLTRGVCIPMAAVAATWLWIAQPNKISKALYSILILGIVLGPLTYRAYDKMNILAPHGIGQMNMIYSKSGKKELKIKYERQGAVWYYGYGSPATGSRPFAPFSDWHTARTGKVMVDIDVDKGAEEWERNFEKNQLSFRNYLWITSENLIMLMFDPSWPDSNPDYVVGYLNYQMRWIWLPLLLLAVVCTSLFAIKDRPLVRSHHWLLPGIFAGWFIIQGFMPLAVNEGRYRKPLELFVVAQLLFLAGTSRRFNPIARIAQTNGSIRPPNNSSELNGEPVMATKTLENEKEKEKENV